MASKERKTKDYRRRLRVKGIITKKGTTKKGNISITVSEETGDYRFTVIRSHKDRFALAEKLAVGRSVSIEGVPKFRTAICTRLKALDKGVDVGKQGKLEGY